MRISWLPILLFPFILLIAACSRDNTAEPIINNPSGSSSSVSTSFSSSSSSAHSYISNGDFSEGMTGWTYWIDSSAAADSNLAGSEFQGNIISADAYWKVQLVSSGILLSNSKTYQLDFDGGTLSGGKYILIEFRMGTNPHDVYYSREFFLGNTISSHRTVFSMTYPDDLTAQMIVHLGSNTGGVVLDNFSLIEIPQSNTNAAGPSTNWSVFIDQASRTAIADNASVPVYPWFPDGHITVLPDGSGNWLMFWGEFESYRTIGPSQYPESHTLLSPTNSILGYRDRSINAYDNGGSWLMSVFRQTGSNLIGFYHAEDHWAEPTPNPGYIAWKSIGVTFSTDNGQSFSRGDRIITSPDPKPGSPAWGGSGDMCVIWDFYNSRWVCFYQQNWIYMAVSTDPNGASNTWFKWDNGSFSTPGIGGDETPVSGLSSVAGANPSVHWNTYLEKWIMVYSAWNGGSPDSIFISSSSDLINWDTPAEIITPINGFNARYVTIIGESDVRAGSNAFIYWADFRSSDGLGGRDWFKAPVSFTRLD